MLQSSCVTVMQCYDHAVGDIVLHNRSVRSGGGGAAGFRCGGAFASPTVGSPNQYVHTCSAHVLEEIGRCHSYE